MITIYHNPRCSKSRQALEILENSKKEFEIKEYIREGLSKEEIERLQKLLGLNVLDFLRQKETEFKETKIDWKDNSLATQKLIELPKLLERPIVINGDKAVIGRPPEIIKAII